MDLTQKLRNLFSRHASITYSDGIIQATIVPAIVRNPVHYKTNGIIPPGELCEGFRSSFQAIRGAITGVYQNSFTEEITTEDRLMSHRFDLGAGRKLCYTIEGIDNIQSPEGKYFSTDITGILVLEDPVLHFDSASNLLRTLLDGRKPLTSEGYGAFTHFLLCATADGSPDISYTSESLGLREKGHPVFERLGFVPKRLLRYVKSDEIRGTIPPMGEYETTIFEPPF